MTSSPAPTPKASSRLYKPTLPFQNKLICSGDTPRNAASASRYAAHGSIFAIFPKNTNPIPFWPYGLFIFFGSLGSCQPELDAELLREDCHSPDSSFIFLVEEPEDTVDWNYLLANRYETDRKGRMLEAPLMDEKLTEASPVEVYFPPISPEFKQALRRNIRLLDAIDHPQKETLKEASYRLLHFEGSTEDLHTQFKLKQSWGKDKRGNAKFTGYYSPFLNVKAHPDERYQHPIYRKPPNWEGPLPDRRAIQEGILEDQSLTIAWTNDPIGLYYMQIQGSGFIKYKDEDRLELLKYAGANGHPYRSIESFLAEQDRYPIESISINGVRKFFNRYPHLLDSILALNPSYTFFARGPSQVIGAGGVPLTANYSVAADTRHFPLGSLFLAAIPVYNDRGKITHHTFTYLVAQDKGGAVRGPGHLDIYCGVGLPGQTLAMHRHHFGRLWLLELK